MKAINRYSGILIGAVLASGMVYAQETPVRQDARAIDVLNSMSAFTTSLDRVLITGVSQIDARLGEGLMVSNSTEIKISVDRPGSLRISSFDGKNHKKLYFHDGTLTVFGKEQGYYAQASVPEEIDAALEFALEEFDVEAPLMDLLQQDASLKLIGSSETILYLTDKARVGGTDCHHIAIRGPETDVQLWVEEGDRPLPRRIMMTSKWEGGSPRVMANIKWNTQPDFEPGIFTFKAPEGSVNIGFAQGQAEQGE